MTTRFLFCAVVVLAVTTVAATGCTGVEGKPVMASSRSEATTSSSSSSSETATTRSQTAPATPTGQPIGTATMTVRGPGPATIRYQINGGAEQTESNVSLPWEKQYPVYNEIQSSVSADAGDAELICTIIMDGNLVSFVTEPRPKCSFAYYG
jgi:hypothetical protein